MSVRWHKKRGYTMRKSRTVYKAHEISKEFGIAYSTIKTDISRYKRFDSYIEAGLMYKQGNSWVIPREAVLEVYGDRIAETKDKETLERINSYEYMIEKTNVSLAYLTHLLSKAPHLHYSTEQAAEFAEILVKRIVCMYVKAVGENQNEMDTPDIFKVLYTEQKNKSAVKPYSVFAIYYLTDAIKEAKLDMNDMEDMQLQHFNALLKLLLTECEGQMDKKDMQVNEKFEWHTSYERKCITTDFFDTLLGANGVDNQNLKQLQNVREAFTSLFVPHIEEKIMITLPSALSRLTKTEFTSYLSQNDALYQIDSNQLIMAAIKKYGKSFVSESIGETLTYYDIEYALFEYLMYTTNKDGSFYVNIPLLLEESSPYKDLVLDTLHEQVIPQTVKCYTEAATYEQTVFDVGNEKYQVSGEEFNTLLNALVDIWAMQNLDKWVNVAYESPQVQAVCDVLKENDYQTALQLLTGNAVLGKSMSPLEQLVLNGIMVAKVDGEKSKLVLTPALRHVSLSKGILMFGLDEKSGKYNDFTKTSIFLNMDDFKRMIRTEINPLYLTLNLFGNPLFDAYMKPIQEHVSLAEFVVGNWLHSYKLEENKELWNESIRGNGNVSHRDIIKKLRKLKEPLQVIMRNRTIKKEEMYDLLTAVPEMFMEKFDREHILSCITEMYTIDGTIAHQIQLVNKAFKETILEHPIYSKYAKEFFLRLFDKKDVSLLQKALSDAIFTLGSRPFIMYLQEQYEEYFKLACFIYIDTDVDKEQYLAVRYGTKLENLFGLSERKWLKLDKSIIKEVLLMFEM